MTGARQLPGVDLALGPGPEFDRLRKVAGVLRGVSGGLGDDCGLFRHRDELIALSTDVSVEGVHFRLDWISPEEAGWRATAAALSDLAAEAADPVGLLCAVTMPEQAAEAELLQVMSGVSAAAKAAGSKVLGGDLTSGPVWSLAVTVVGRARQPVTRGGAEPGDRLWVTGWLGGARAALQAWLRGSTPSPETRTRFARPEPRIGAGLWLARHGARAMIDLSDGLAGDAWHVARASGISLVIDLDSIPIAPGSEQEARRLELSAQQFAAEGGDDYELLVALPHNFDSADLFARECGIPLTAIGNTGEGSGVSFLLAGRPVELKGFNHFG